MLCDMKNMENCGSEALDNLVPLPYMIFGKKKEHNPLEEFWMNKLEAIESQYDKHIIKLERSLLDNRANRRRLFKKEEQITKLGKEVEAQSTKIGKLSTSKSKLVHELSLKTYKTSRLAERLQDAEGVKEKIQKSLEAERLVRMKKEKELMALKQRLSNLERDKRFLLNDLALKDGQRQIVQDQNAQLAQNKVNLIKNLTDIDQERRIRGEVNMKLVEDVGTLLQGCKTQEYHLLKQRKEIDLMLETMKYKRKEQEETLRKLGLNQKHLQGAEEEKKLKEGVMEHLQREVKHWKEDVRKTGEDNRSQGLEIKDLHRENSQLRCQLAELRAKLGRNEDRMKSLELEKKRTNKELEKVKGQAQSLHKVMTKNEEVKQRLATKILKANPHLLQTTLEQQQDMSWMPKMPRKRDKKESKEIESYKKQIWGLERQKGEQECKINELRRSQNRLQFQLQKYDGMEKEILWTEKAMVKLEGDRNRLEDLMKSMALNVPKKMPFEKLVTDPSILDRMAKYQVLQKRLMQQTDKVEALKKSAMQIVEYRKLKLEDELTDKRREIPAWKLSHWKQSSSSNEDTLADVDQQLLDHEGTAPRRPPVSPTPLAERKYYTEYMNYLEGEIPQIKKQIALIERKQQYNQQHALDVETKAKNAALVNRGHFEDEGEKVKKVVVQGEEGEGDEELEEEEEDDEDEDEGEDSDVDGFLGVVSVDEPESAAPRLPAAATEQDNQEKEGVNNEGGDKDEGEECHTEEEDDDD